MGAANRVIGDFRESEITEMYRIIFNKNKHRLHSGVAGSPRMLMNLGTLRAQRLIDNVDKSDSV